jgi:hypothetical protein
MVLTFLHSWELFSYCEFPPVKANKNSKAYVSPMHKALPDSMFIIVNKG